MSAVTIQQMADRVATLMAERLHVKGSGLAEKLKKGGRLLPRKVRDAAGELAQAAQMSQNPKLLVQVNNQKVAEAYDVCVRHLNGLNRWQSRKGLLLGIASSVVFSLIVVGLLLLGVLVWRGFL